MKDGKDKRASNVKNFWHNGFTVNETKFSTLMLLLMIALTYLLVTNVLNDYAFTDKIFDIVKWLIGAVVGINGVNTFSDHYDLNQKNTDYNGNDYDLK